MNTRSDESEFVEMAMTHVAKIAHPITFDILKHHSYFELES